MPISIHFQGLDKLEIYIRPGVDPMKIVSREIIGDDLDEIDHGAESIKVKRHIEGKADLIEVFDERLAEQMRWLDRNEGSGVYRHREIVLKGQDGVLLNYGVEVVRMKVQNYPEAFQVKLTTGIMDNETWWYKPLTFAAFAIMKGQSVPGGVDSYSKIVIYWSFFARFWMELVREFIRNYIDESAFWCMDEKRSPICRIDVCVDINEPKRNIDSCNIVNPRSNIEWVREIGAHETSYFGTNSSWKMLRVYDKVRDSIARWKNDLYPHISWSGDWTRMEVEFYPFKLSDPKNISKVKDYPWKEMDLESVFDKELIKMLMLGFIKRKNRYFLQNKKEWKDLEAQGIRFESKEVVKLSLDQMPKQYISQTRWLLTRIYEMCWMEGVQFIVWQALSKNHWELIWKIIEACSKVEFDSLLEKKKTTLEMTAAIIERKNMERGTLEMCLEILKRVNKEANRWNRESKRMRTLT